MCSLLLFDMICGGVEEVDDDDDDDEEEDELGAVRGAVPNPGKKF